MYFDVTIRIGNMFTISMKECSENKGIKCIKWLEKWRTVIAWTP